MILKPLMMVVMVEMMVDPLVEKLFIQILLLSPVQIQWPKVVMSI